MIKEVTQFIADKAGLTRDLNIFAGHRLSDTIDICDVVLETTGGEIFTDLPDRADIVFQVLSRAKTYFTARARAWTIYKALFPDLTDEGLPLGSMEISAVAPATQDYEAMVIEPLAPPQSIGIDSKGRFEFSCNYIFRLQNA